MMLEPVRDLVHLVCHTISTRGIPSEIRAFGETRRLARSDAEAVRERQFQELLHHVEQPVGFHRTPTAQSIFAAQGLNDLPPLWHRIRLTEEDILPNQYDLVATNDRLPAPKRNAPPSAADHTPGFCSATQRFHRRKLATLRADRPLRSSFGTRTAYLRGLRLDISAARSIPQIIRAIAFPAHAFQAHGLSEVLDEPSP